MIDAGISCREIEKRMGSLGLSMSATKAVFVSHEHGDHITGIPGLSKKYRLPVYVTPATYSSARIPVEETLVRSFSARQDVRIGDLHITPFRKKHDAADPHSFVVSDGTVRVGVFTDIGILCEEVKYFFHQCHAVFLESNYCANMLEKGSYPWPLKQRIRGGQGHLSNRQALELFTTCKGPLTHLILSHLSKNNNRPELVESLFLEQAGSTEVTVASRYGPTKLFRVEAVVTHTTAVNHFRPTAIGQLSLFP